MPSPDLLTYRYNGHMVYVTPAKSYEVPCLDLFRRVRNLTTCSAARRRVRTERLPRARLPRAGTHIHMRERQRATEAHSHLHRSYGVDLRRPGPRTLRGPRSRRQKPRHRHRLRRRNRCRCAATLRRRQGEVRAERLPPCSFTGTVTRAQVHPASRTAAAGGEERDRAVTVAVSRRTKTVELRLDIRLGKRTVRQKGRVTCMPPQLTVFPLRPTLYPPRPPPLCTQNYFITCFYLLDSVPCTIYIPDFSCTPAPFSHLCQYCNHL